MNWRTDMDIDAILEHVQENNPEATMFINPDYKAAIIGYTENDEGLPVLVYDFNTMCDLLAEEYAQEDIEDPEMAAIEFLEYNTIRTLPYMGSGRPVIIYH